MTDPARHAPLVRAAAQRRGDARQRTQQALHDLHRTGASISFVAKPAKPEQRRRLWRGRSPSAGRRRRSRAGALQSA